MKKSLLLIVVALVLPFNPYAQTAINKSVAFQPGQKITMHFDYPELIRVSTWDKNEVSVQGTVSINNGENDDAFVLNLTSAGGVVSIKNEIPNLKNLPHRITVYRDGQKMVFRDKEAFRKYQNEHGRNFESHSEGVDMDIVLEIKVPRNADTRVESVYGTVEIKDFAGPLSVTSTYGGVDAALTERAMGEISAETNYGEIYSNLDIKFGGEKSREENFHTFVSANPGSGPKYSFESKYGNVYLRKAN